MSVEPKAFEELKSLKKGVVSEKSEGPLLKETTKPLPSKDALGRSYATGKRKTSIARVWVKSGKGTMTVNGKTVTDYFARSTLQTLVHQPLSLLDRLRTLDVTATVRGGGLSGQAGALRHGISKALALFDPDSRFPLKKEGLLTRDSRVVERKKYGFRKARRRPQFTKR